jgi:hypothetical protein
MFTKVTEEDIARIEGIKPMLSLIVQLTERVDITELELALKKTKEFEADRSAGFGTLMLVSQLYSEEPINERFNIYVMEKMMGIKKAIKDKKDGKRYFRDD